jgi:hypothetical protein
MISPCLVEHAELGRTINNSAHTLNFNPQFAAHHKTPSLIEALNDGMLEFLFLRHKSACMPQLTKPPQL